MKVAIVGFGRMGHTILQALRNLPEISGIPLCDVRVEATPGPESGLVFTTRIEDVLQDNEISLVFIATPNGQHQSVAADCLRARKAVMLEKPIAETLEASHAVVSESERLGVFRRRLRRWEFRLEGGAFKSRLVESQTWSEKEDHHYFHDTTTQTQDIMRRVATGQPPMTSARDSLETMRVVDATDRAANLGKAIRL